MSVGKKVFIVCSGVGHINRGYESFTLECFDALKHSTEFELFLLKGAGNSSQKEITIPCLKRNSKLTSFLSKIIGKEKYWIEQLTFLMGMIPTLITKKPAVIYYSDFVLGTWLWQLRRFFNFKYKLLFSNGAPNGPPFTRMDHVQQLLPMYIKEAVYANTPLSMQTLLPYAITIDVKPNAFHKDYINELRQSLQLPLNKKIIISVGAVNTHHKRMDYVVSEFSKLNDNYFLLILGQIDESSKVVFDLAESLLKKDSYLIKQVAGTEVRSFMLASDYFILASLNEGLPRVLPEALSAGLLPIVHDYAVTRETLLNFGVYENMKADNVLLNALHEVDASNTTKEEICNYAINTYSWNSLRPAYESLIKKCLA